MEKHTATPLALLILALWGLVYAVVEIQPNVGFSTSVSQLIGILVIILIFIAVVLLMRTLSLRTLLIFLMIIPLMGVVDSAFLSYAHFGTAAAVCPAPTEGQIPCDIVNKSMWSELFGIPVAYLGFAYYLIFFAVATMGVRSYGAIKKKKLHHHFMRHHLLGLSICGVLFTIWLNYVQFFELMTLCALCEVSATTVLLMLCGSIVAMTKTK